jgi:hypothetical protein
MARSHKQTHDAGRHYAVAEALMRGLDAELIGGSSFIQVNGHKARVQVAAKGAWMIENVEQFHADTVDFNVLVNVTHSPPEFYICPGEQLRADVLKRHQAYLASKGGVRPRNPDSKHAAITPEQVAKWRDAWRRLA